MRRFALAAALAAALVPATAAPALACESADADPTATPVAEVRAATVCLMNRERRTRGLVSLRRNDGLELAGRRHAQDMVGHRYFAHVSRSGTAFDERIRRAGYLRAGGRALLGENLAWGTGPLSTPREIVRSWMESRGHRANVLRAGFREVGVGIVRAVPVEGHGGATYAAEFGARW